MLLNMRRFNYRFVLGSVGLVLAIEAFFMILSAFIGHYYKEDVVSSIYISAAITLLSGLLLLFFGRKEVIYQIISPKRSLYYRYHGVVNVSTLWHLPYIISDAIPSFANAF